MDNVCAGKRGEEFKNSIRLKKDLFLINSDLDVVELFDDPNKKITLHRIHSICNVNKFAEIFGIQ